MGCDEKYLETETKVGSTQDFDTDLMSIVVWHGEPFLKKLSDVWKCTLFEGRHISKIQRLTFLRDRKPHGRLNNVGALKSLDGHEAFDLVQHWLLAFCCAAPPASAGTPLARIAADQTPKQQLATPRSAFEAFCGYIICELLPRAQHVLVQIICGASPGSTNQVTST